LYKLFKIIGRKKASSINGPSQSADCNPIEYLWDLDRSIRDELLRNKNHLWATLEEKWKNIGGVLQKLIDRTMCL